MRFNSGRDLALFCIACIWGDRVLGPILFARNKIRQAAICVSSSLVHQVNHIILQLTANAVDNSTGE